MLGTIGVTTLQFLSVLGDFNVVWPSPVKDIMAFTKFLVLDLDVVQAQCVMGSSPLMNFTARLIVFPFILLVIFIFAKIREYRLQSDLWAEFTNTAGSAAMVLNISILVAVCAPFYCYTHPGGESSVLKYSVILCGGEEHQPFVGIAIVGLLMLPLPYLSYCAYGVWNYEERVADGDDAFVFRYRFLFARFRIDAKFYGGFLVLRNSIIPLVPIFVRDNAPVQILATGCILIAGGFFQVHWWPWRAQRANHIDGVISVLLVLTILLGALLTKETLSPLAAGIVATVCIITMFVGIVIIGIKSLWQLVFPSVDFPFFICHSKATSAAQARLINVLLAQRKLRCFIDSDNLTDLSTLFFTVASGQVGTLVVLLSSETLRRPWCCGEICVAMAAGVQLLVLRDPSFDEGWIDDSDEIEKLAKDPVLSGHHIQLKTVEDSYSKLRKLPYHSLCEPSVHKTYTEAVMYLMAKRLRTGPSLSLLVRFGLMQAQHEDAPASPRDFESNRTGVDSTRTPLSPHSPGRLGVSETGGLSATSCRTRTTRRPQQPRASCVSMRRASSKS